MDKTGIDPFGNITYTLNIVEVKNTNSTRHKSTKGETHTVKSSDSNTTQDFSEETKPEWADTFEDLQRLNREQGLPEFETRDLNNFSEKFMNKVSGYKENDGKTDYSEINLGILDLAAERFTANKHKYSQGNMKKPLDKDNLCWAMFRHVKKMLQPPKDDPENYKEHLAAVICNASMILDQLNIEENNNGNY